MISNDEKGKSLFAIIHDIANGASPDATHDSMLSLLQMEGTEKKLYKYRSFTSEHSLPSLTSNTLYCSKASEFNDPFDCKMGIDLQSYMASQCDLAEAYSILDQFFQYCDNPTDYRSIPDNKRLVFEDTHRKILDSVDFISKQAAAQLSSEDLGRYILCHLEVILDLLIPLVKETKLYKLLSKARLDIPKLIELINPERVLLFPYDSFAPQNFSITQNSDIDTIGVLFALCKHLNLVSPQKTVQLESELNHSLQNYADCLINAFRVGSLCVDPKNRLMWAHYANNHRGFCIEYDCSSVPENQYLLPVFYSNHRKAIPLNIAKFKNQQSLLFDILCSLFTKDEIWQYEQEWRLVITSTTPPNVTLPVSGIYLGVQCSLEHRNMLIQIAKRMSIPLYQMQMDREKYLLHAELIGSL